MTVCPTEGEPTIIKCPADINGYEYEIREVTEKDVNVYCEYPQKPTDAIPVQVEVKTTKAKCTTIKPEKVEYIVEI